MLERENFAQMWPPNGGRGSSPGPVPTPPRGLWLPIPSKMMFPAGPVDQNTLGTPAKVISNREIFKNVGPKHCIFLMDSLHCIVCSGMDFYSNLVTERCSGLLPWASTDTTTPAVASNTLENDVSSWPCRLELVRGTSEGDIESRNLENVGPKHCVSLMFHCIT